MVDETPLAVVGAGPAGLSAARYTRAGMGLSQGRMCGPTVAALLAERLGVPPASLPPPSVRPPVKPVPLEALALPPPEPGARRRRTREARR